jgi:hypothetical protein
LLAFRETQAKVIAMTCQTIQNRILALPDPRQLPDPLREHVDGCPACLGWWKQAARLERLLEQLPTPPAPADKKAVLLEDLTTGPVIATVPAVARGSGRSLFADVWSLPGAKHLAGLAAAVLILIGGWLMTRPGSGPNVVAQPARDPLLDKVVKRNIDLAHAKTPNERLETLGVLADDLSESTRGFARVATPEELGELSGLFKTVVADGIVKQAERLPPHAMTPSQKRQLLDGLAAKLAAAGQQAEQAARESPPQAQPALKTIADTARDGQTRLKARVGA